MGFNDPDLCDGTFIKLEQEWRLLSGERPVPRIEGAASYYGCETGCTGWTVYLIHPDGKQEQLGRFEFTEGTAIRMAEEESEKRGNLPIVMEKDLWP